MPNRREYIIGVFIVAILVAAGCSTTKRLGEDDVLYTGVRKMKIESTADENVPGSVKSAVQEPLSVKPNNPLFSPYIRTPLPIGLWVWNYFYTEREHGFKHWIYQRLAKKPVLIADVDPDKRMEVVEQILDHHGYFSSEARYEIIPKKNPKKARISYWVDIAPAWSFNSIFYPDPVDPVTVEIDSIKTGSLIHTGSRFDIDTLQAERIRITNYLRNRGYYYFRPDYIEYLADSVANRFKVDVEMVMAGGIPQPALLPHTIGDIDITLLNPRGGTFDSLYLDDVKVKYQGKLKIRKKVLERSLKISPGDTTRLDDINATLNNLTKLNIFRYVNLNVTPLDSLRGIQPIDMSLSAAFDSPLEAELEADFSSKSNSYIGPGVIFGVRHKNLFNGGEVLSFRVNGSYEWQTGNKSATANSTAINSYEIGFTSSLMFPRLLAPQFIRRNEKFDSKTTFTLGASLLNRPRFFTMLSFNASMAYDFQSSPYSFHNLTLFKFTYNHLLRTTTEFKKVMEDNPAIEQSFKNQFIPAASYTYTYNRGYGRYRQNPLFWQTTLTSAGNIFWLLDKTFGNSNTNKILGIRYSQFIKGISELRYNHYLGQKNYLASRLIIGAAYPYGNSRVLPYTEQFYIGGANSIRAFTIRSIGPGSYVPDESNLYGYFDQTGEFKLEANVEYRFKILGNLNGAVFMDAGNVWLIRKDEDRPGGRIGFRKMWDEIALGTGVGLRFDITFLVIRADLGIGLHLPYNTGKSGYYNIPAFKDGLGFHLAIGYPF